MATRASLLPPRPAHLPSLNVTTNAIFAGASYINKKYLGNKFSHDQLESITDAGRGAFEKSTG